MRGIIRTLCLLGITVAFLGLATAQRALPAEMDYSLLQHAFDGRYPVGELQAERPELRALTYRHNTYSGSVLVSDSEKYVAVFSFLEPPEEELSSIALGVYCQAMGQVGEVEEYSVEIRHLSVSSEEGRTKRLLLRLVDSFTFTASAQAHCA